MRFGFGKGEPAQFHGTPIFMTVAWTRQDGKFRRVDIDVSDVLILVAVLTLVWIVAASFGVV